jgi:hypothetical protein
MSSGGTLSRGFLVLGKALLPLVLVLTACAPTGQALASPDSGKPCHARHINEADPQAWLPDPRCTPGAINPTVTLGQLCPTAHTINWRPPASYTSKLKRDQLANKYDYVDSSGSHTPTPTTSEEDHLISLELGGSPSAELNLWPEPHASFNEKDKVEGAAHAAICAGRLTLPQAQQGIATNWIELGKRLGVKY